MHQRNTVGQCTDELPMIQQISSEPGISAIRWHLSAKFVLRAMSRT